MSGQDNGEGFSGFRPDEVEITRHVEKAIPGRAARDFINNLPSRRYARRQGRISLAIAAGLAIPLAIALGPKVYSSFREPDRGVGTNSSASPFSEPDSSPATNNSPAVSSPEASATTPSLGREQEQINRELTTAFSLPEDEAARIMDEVGYPQSSNERIVVASAGVREAFKDTSSGVETSHFASLSFMDGSSVSDLLTKLQKAEDLDLRKNFHAFVFSDPKSHSASLSSEIDPTGEGIGDIPSTDISVTRLYQGTPDGSVSSSLVVSTSINNALQIVPSLDDGGFNFSNNTELLNRLGFIPNPKDSNGKEVVDDTGVKGIVYTDVRGNSLVIDTRGNLVYTTKGKVIKLSGMPKWDWFVQANTPSEAAAVVGNAMAFYERPTDNAAKVDDNFFAKLPFGAKQNRLLIKIHDSRDNIGNRIDNTDGGLPYDQELYLLAAAQSK